MVDIIYHKKILGYRNTITSDGRVFSWKCGYPVELTPFFSGAYWRVKVLTKAGKEVNRFVHVLVALAWIPNPKNLPKVNHIDENKENNDFHNLEWCTDSENYLHSLKNRERKGKRPVYQLDKSDKIIKKFKSVRKASRSTGIGASDISVVCSVRGGHRKRDKNSGVKNAGGYSWCYQEDFGNLRKIIHKNAKPVNQYTREGEFIRRFDSVGEAAEFIGRSNGNIIGVCNGTKKTSGGFCWKYAKLENIVKSSLELETEDWKILKNFSKYKVSRDGRVYSIAGNKILVPCINCNRKYVCLTNNEGIRKSIAVYRLVAFAYIPNPNDYPIVNHLDHNSLNDCVENLELCDNSRNMQYNYDMEKHSGARPVSQFSLDGVFIKRYRSCNEASRATKSPQGSIGRAIVENESQIFRGYIWKYDK